jgi:uncharacterized protein (DUF486 family)
MTIAWYGHLKTMKDKSLWMVILVSWLIALIEYAFQVPGNRLGAAVYSLPQLKIIQEVISLIVFAVFAVSFLDSQLSWNHLWAALCLVGAVYFVFQSS